MKVRLIVECDHADLGRVLSSLPSAATWSATRAPAAKPESPMRKIVLDEYTTTPPSVIKPKPPRPIRKGFKLNVLTALKGHPPMKSAGVREALLALGIPRKDIQEGVGARLLELVKADFVERSGEKYAYDYRITKAGELHLQEQGR